MSMKEATQFKMLCETLLVNYPSIVHHRSQLETLGAYADGDVFIVCNSRTNMTKTNHAQKLAALCIDWKKYTSWNTRMN